LALVVLNLGSYHGPHSFSKVSSPVVMRRSELGSYHGHYTFSLRCLLPLSWGGLNLGSYHGPHTFSLRCLRPLSWGGLNLGSYHGPHTFSLRCLRPLLWGGCILLQLRCFKVAPKVLYHHMDYERDYCHWLHRKRKLWYAPHNPSSQFLCLELLCLSAWQLNLHQLSLMSLPFIIGGRLLSQVFAPPQLGASITALFLSLHAQERSSHVVFIKSTRDFLLYNLYIVYALSFIWEHFFFLHLLFHYSTLLDLTGTPA